MVSDGGLPDKLNIICSLVSDLFVFLLVSTRGLERMLVKIIDF